jgi:hypothetical protein
MWCAAGLLSKSPQTKSGRLGSLPLFIALEKG